MKLIVSALLSMIIFESYAQKIGEHPIKGIKFLKSNPKKMELTKLLWKTEPVNEDEVYNQLGLEKENKGNFKLKGRLTLRNGIGFKTRNPYFPRYSMDHKKGYQRFPGLKKPIKKRKIEFEVKKKKIIKFYNQGIITSWFLNLEKKGSVESKEVCAIKFTNSSETKYKLKTFKNSDEAKKGGWFITHKYKCGTCSTLKDLAVYMAKPDLTDPVRFCTKKPTLRMIKSCLMNKVGFTERCSESWTYNADHTKKRCMGICMKDYGLVNILTNNMQGSNVDKDGNLKPCIACDEYRSGPGFKYAAARTRRWSGLVSAIKRGSDEIYKVNHFKYFKKTKNWKWFD
ncbi:MAG: hypothetical protein CME68_10530 [Halobacteriovoraceae bacterium]|nr:hypothetical protein [Halobacteriovoraceae bacterium]